MEHAKKLSRTFPPSAVGSTWGVGWGWGGGSYRANVGDYGTVLAGSVQEVVENACAGGGGGGGDGGWGGGSGGDGERLGFAKGRVNGRVTVNGRSLASGRKSVESLTTGLRELQVKETYYTHKRDLLHI